MKSLSKDQVKAIKDSGINCEIRKVEELINQEDIMSLGEDDLVLLAKIENATYRAGFPVVTDVEYDKKVVAELEMRNPKHEFLATVEPEPVPLYKTVPLPEKMLSTDKVYSDKEILQWIRRVEKFGQEIGLDFGDVLIKISHKLDGYAAYDDGERLYTRGDGLRGQDITRAFNRGLKVAKDAERGMGPGEIVVDKEYFDKELSDDFENTRNVLASVIAEKNVNEKVLKAIKDGACVFYPFASLEGWVGSCEDFKKQYSNIFDNMWGGLKYEVDGLVVEVINDDMKKLMGSTRKHHRWQIAYKRNLEKATVVVSKVIPQTSRTGRVTPVAEIPPIKLSGATIRRATLHNYGMVKSKGVGKGAVVELVRSGLVIPKIEKIIEVVDPEIPVLCPSCHSEVVWDGDNIFCPNSTDCPAQAENTLIHFFKTMPNVDGFGPKVVEKLNENSIAKVHQVYELNVEDLVGMGFGEKTAINLVDQLKLNKVREMEDWRFLSAFGIPRLGEASCERLLSNYNIDEIFRLEVDEVANIEGFAETSAKVICEGLKDVRSEFLKVYSLGFRLSQTKQSKEQLSGLQLDGIQVVFSGTMKAASRSEMESNAKNLGAKVGKSVSRKTDFLVVGDSVGEKKVTDAKSKGVKVLSEEEYEKYIKMGYLE